MKAKQKILGIIVAIAMMVVGLVTSVSAAKVGDPYSWGGVQIGWILIIITVILAFALYWGLKAVPFKKTIPILIVLGVAGLLLAVTDVAVEPVISEVTPGVTWSVTAATHQGGNITIDNDENKIIIMAHVNSTGTILNDDDSAFTQPILNFTISPTMTEGLTDLSLGATTLASVTNPDAAFTVSGTSYDLFSDVSGTTSNKDLAWYADGTTEYEFHYVTVQFGSSEIAQLTVTYNPAGISQLATGTIKSSSISIGGQTYTMSLIITGEDAT